MPMTTAPSIIDDMLAGYAECAVWSSTTDEGMPLDAFYSVDDFAEDALASMREDIIAFVDANRDDMIQYAQERETHGGHVWEYAGHDLWLCRNGHGTGFWDRGLGELGDRLSKAARAIGESYAYIGDDGKLYV